MKKAVPVELLNAGHETKGISIGPRMHQDLGFNIRNAKSVRSITSPASERGRRATIHVMAGK